VTVVAFIGCKSAKKSSGGEEPKKSFMQLSEAAVKRGGFATQVVASGLIERRVQLQGHIKANEDNVTSVVSHVGGVALTVTSQLGARVKKGDPMAELQSKEMGQAQLEYIGLHSKMSFAYNLLKIEQGIYNKKIGTKVAYIKARAEFDRAVMAKDLAAQKLKLLGVADTDINNLPSRPKDKLTVYVLRAPVDGVIIKKSIARGEMVNSDRVVFTLANLNTVWFDIMVPVQYLGAIKPRDEVAVYSGKLQKTVTGKITYISPTADTQTRSALVRLLLPNEKGLWRPGLCAMGEFTVKKQQVAVVVPQTSLVRIGGKPAVFVQVKPRSYQLKYVVLGEGDKVNAGIRGGINAGEVVVTANVIALKGEWLATMGD
ncbi:efflux RND transporter periplasmic adaptor subunit, partial [Myxococcota bacterium]|nr:efflux RND transporter periplasmic adaptor subunit [Myxococcota bacterium]